MFLILESLQFRHAVYTHFLHRAYKYNFAVVISVVYTEKVKVAQTRLPQLIPVLGSQPAGGRLPGGKLPY